MGLIQKAVEKEGLAKISITHLPELTEKVDPPRALLLKFPLGRSFGAANRRDFQRKIVLDMLNGIVEMDETEKFVNYHIVGREIKVSSRRHFLKSLLAQEELSSVFSF